MKSPPPRHLIHRQAGSALRFARRIRRRLRSVIAPAPVILCYHRVFTPERDPHMLSVSPERFRAQMEIVRQRARPVALGDPSDLSARGVVVTFDDGYLDNLENALPILRALEIPATIYIATGNIGAKREFWWDDLERLTLGAPNLPEIVRLEINGRDLECNPGSNEPDDRSWNVLSPNERSPRQRLFCELHALLRPLAAAQQEAVLAQLRAITGTSPEARPLYRCLAESELKMLATEPLITLGAHTVSHPDLALRSRDEQRAEIAGSKARLEQLIAHSVEHFSYPYGSQNDDSIEICAELNLRTAVTCIAQPVERGVSPFRLPRLLVRDWDGPEFARQLAAVSRI
jgi:peptidoglycan/xylan/chitin deacetylase (PgdA/CDA1 family)